MSSEIYQNSQHFSEFPDAWIKINDFLIESCSKNIKVSIEATRTEIKPVVMEKHQFDNGDETLSVAFFQNVIFPFPDFYHSDARIEFNDPLSIFFYEGQTFD